MCLLSSSAQDSVLRDSCEPTSALCACHFLIPPQLFLCTFLSDRSSKPHFAQLDSHRTLIIYSPMYTPLIYSLFWGNIREMTHAQKGAPIQLFWRELIDPLPVKWSAQLQLLQFKNIATTCGKNHESEITKCRTITMNHAVTSVQELSFWCCSQHAEREWTVLI